MIPSGVKMQPFNLDEPLIPTDHLIHMFADMDNGEALSGLKGYNVISPSTFLL